MWFYWISKRFYWAFSHIYTSKFIDIHTKRGKDDRRRKKTNDKEDLKVILHLPLIVTHYCTPVQNHKVLNGYLKVGVVQVTKDKVDFALKFKGSCLELAFVRGKETQMETERTYMYSSFMGN